MQRAVFASPPSTFFIKFSLFVAYLILMCAIYLVDKDYYKALQECSLCMRT